MKKIFILLLLLFCFLWFFGCSKNLQNGLVGKWKCELYGSDLLIEFTHDGKFIDHTTGAVNSYTAKKDLITTFIDGYDDSKVTLTYSVIDNRLYYGGVEYIRIEDEKSTITE